MRAFRRWQYDESSGREEAVDPKWLVRRQEKLDLRNAERLFDGMVSLRGCYIKLGQVLSVMGGFLPRVYGKKLEKLQDSVPPQSYAAIAEVIESELKKSIDELFESIDKVPIAAASLGQVHSAILPDGRRVAVKVLYPGIREVLKIDLKVVRLVLHVYKWFFPVQNIEVIHVSLIDLLKRETDYRHEALCMQRMASDFKDEHDLIFPEVVEELSTEDVLVMTFVEGIKITHVDLMREAGIEPEQVARRLIESFYKQVFVHHFFHADPHPGNFFVQAGRDGSSPKIVFLDFGAVSEVSDSMVEGMIDVLWGFFQQDDALVFSGIEKIGFIAQEGDQELLKKTVKTYFEKLLRMENRTAGALMRANAKDLERLADPEVARSELRTLMRSVRYPDGWFYIERAAIMMFWLAGQIAPEVDTLQVGFPHVMPLISDRLRAPKMTEARAPS